MPRRARPGPVRASDRANWRGWTVVLQDGTEAVVVTHLRQDRWALDSPRLGRIHRHRSQFTPLREPPR